MRRFLPIVVLLVLVVAAGGWWFAHRRGGPGGLVLYGSVDLRQVDLPFTGQQRVAAVLVEEGDRVAAGQVLARLDADRLIAAAAEAEARVASQRQAVARLENGSRPEEIAQAKANVAAAEAELARAKSDYDRLRPLDATRAASPDEVERAKWNLEAAAARRDAQRQALQLTLVGPRDEDKAEARAMLASLEAQLAARRKDLDDAELRSPVAGVVRSRVLEAGEMAMPNVPAFTIAVTDPKWVRAYAHGPELGALKPGTAASVGVDAFPGRAFDGWVGFVSPVAEFTPRQVETPELRTSLVYEVRVFVRDPDDALRLGMPATVEIRPGQPAATRPSTQAAR
jgi:HlyD family secretion protein